MMTLKDYKKLSKEEMQAWFDSLQQEFVLEDVEFTDTSVDLYYCGFDDEPDAGLKLEFAFARSKAIALFDWYSKIFDITKDSRVNLKISIVLNDEPVDNKVVPCC